MKGPIFILAFLLFLPLLTEAQPKERKEKIYLDGEIVTALITENDTILIADLEDVSVSSLRAFTDREEYRKYLKYRRYAAKVYPYAAEGIRIFRELEYVTANMKESKRKRHVRRLNREYKKRFKGELKNLTKTQGKILIEMVERELKIPFYTLVKDLRGGFTASYWHELAKINGYDLKDVYERGQDKILDIVLDDYDLSYEIDLQRQEELERKQEEDDKN